MLLKNHPAYPTRQKPDTGRCATTDGGGDERTRDGCMLGIRPDSAVFIRPSVKFPLFQNGDKSSEICYFQTVRARNHLITFLSFPFARVVSGGEINNWDLHLDVSSQREVPPPAHCCPSTAATQISGFSGNCTFEPEPLFGRSRWRRPCPHDSPHKRSCTQSDGLQPRAVWTSNYKAGERASRLYVLAGRRRPSGDL